MKTNIGIQTLELLSEVNTLINKLYMKVSDLVEQERVESIGEKVYTKEELNERVNFAIDVCKKYFYGIITDIKDRVSTEVEDFNANDLVDLSLEGINGNEINIEFSQDLGREINDLIDSEVPDEDDYQDTIDLRLTEILSKRENESNQ